MPGVRSARSARLAVRGAGAAAEPPLVQVAKSERSQTSLKITLSANGCRIGRARHSGANSDGHWTGCGVLRARWRRGTLDRCMLLQFEGLRHFYLWYASLRNPASVGNSVARMYDDLIPLSQSRHHLGEPIVAVTNLNWLGPRTAVLIGKNGPLITLSE